MCCHWQPPHSPKYAQAAVDAVRRGVQHFDGAAVEDAGTLAVQFGDDGLAGDAAIDEDRAAVVVRDGAAFEGHVAERERSRVRAVRYVFRGVCGPFQSSGYQCIGR